MGITVTPLTSSFGAEITGADVTKTDDQELIDTVNEAMAEYGLVVIRDQFIDDDQQIAFSRLFGPLELPPDMGTRRISRNGVRPEIYDVSNLDDDGEIIPQKALRRASNKANEEFHTDSSFNALPTKWSILSARLLPPEGGDTEFADTRAAYDALPDEMREKAEQAVAEHWFWKTRGRAGYDTITDDMRRAMPEVTHSVVRAIPESGRKALYVGNHATHILGWEREAGERFLDELNAFAAQERFRYRHKWQDGDLVIWDNRCTIHRATGYDNLHHKRDLRRTTINEHGPETSSTQAIGYVPAS